MLKEAKEYIESLFSRSELTRRQYSRDIEEFCMVCNISNLEELLRLTSKDLVVYNEHMNSKNWSNNTRNLKVQTLKLFGEYLVENLYMKKNIFKYFSRLPSDTKETRALTDEECQKIINVIDSTTTKKRNKVLFSFMVTSCFRKFECSNLKLSDINGNEIVIRGKKNVFVEKFVIPQHISDMLKDYIETERAEILKKYNTNTPYLFVSNTGNKIDSTSFYKSLKMYAKKAGIKDWKRVTVHGCRHTGITRYYDNTKDIIFTSKVARHSNISTTQRYIHMSKEEYKNNIEKFAFKGEVS
jgi:site-specific recombinase XerD